MEQKDATSVKHIYERFTDGNVLTDNDLFVGHHHFSELALSLYASGPVFRLAAVEARRVADALDGFQQARSNGKARRTKE